MKKNEQNQKWIFLRGLSRGKGHWSFFPEYFRKKFPQTQIEFLDLPGNGDRFDELSPLRLDDYVEDLRSRSELLKETKVNLLSISLGSMIAVTWAQKYPQDFLSLTLINTSFQGLPPWKRFNLLALPKFAQVPFVKSPWEKETLISSVVCNSIENRNKALPDLAQQTQRSHFRWPNFFRQIYAAAQADFSVKPSVPVLILASQKDRLVSVDCSLALGKKWNITPYIHPAGGHDLPIDDPDWIIERIEEFALSMV